MYHFKVKLAAKFKCLHLPARQLRLTLQPPQASMVRTYYQVRTQQVMVPMLQHTQDCYDLPIGSIIILLCHREEV